MKGGEMEDVVYVFTSTSQFGPVLKSSVAK